MPAPIEHFTRSAVLRMAGITPSQLGYWERLQFIQPSKVLRKKFYTFRDLVSLRAVKELRARRVPAGQLRQAIQALRRQLTEVDIPLTELRVRRINNRIVVEYQGVTIEPLSGQLVMNFESRARGRKVRCMPEQGLDDGFLLALEYEGCPELRLQAMEAYRRVIEKFPQSIEPRLNLGVLLYEEGRVREAAQQFGAAMALDPDSPLARFNLGTTLEDLGELEEARRHLREALRLKPDYSDAHYNLARVYEKSGAYREALRHWRRYLELDPDSEWAEYARERLRGELHSL